MIGYLRANWIIVTAALFFMALSLGVGDSYYALIGGGLIVGSTLRYFA